MSRVSIGTVILAALCASFLLLLNPAAAQGGEDLPYPRLANYYLRGEIREKDIDLFSGWDLMVFSWHVDRSDLFRGNLDRIKSFNPDAVFLAYHLSLGANSTFNPPDPLFTLAQDYDWWLYDYQGNKVVDPTWQFINILNFTNTDASKGDHPNGVKPNYILAEHLMVDHVQAYDFWDGIFYDVYTDNLRTISADTKDATANHIAEYDFIPNGDEPLFDHLWREGMISLAQNTLSFDSGVIMVGNGLHQSAMSYLNGRMYENYQPSSLNLSDLASVQKYLAETERERPISIVNGMARGQDPTDYTAMRFALTSTLLTDAFFSFDFGSRDHAETLWYDEYSVKQTGEVAAVTTTLTEEIDGSQESLPVSSTEGFPNSGVILIDGEQIHYDSKSGSAFLQCTRGYPMVTSKYDLCRPHDSGSLVVFYLNEHTGYLGFPVSDAYDVDDPSVKLKDLFADAGFFAYGEKGENIDSRVWRRDFDNGTVVFNPTSEARIVDGLGNMQYTKIKGLQDTGHNDGSLVQNSLAVNSKDGYVLIRVTNSDERAPEPPQGVQVIE